MTVVKYSDGYIFGGYTDVAWMGGRDRVVGYESSVESFLFTLKDLVR